MSWIRYRTALVLVAAVPMLAACPPDVTGVYQAASGMATLELKSGGKAVLTMQGESAECEYKAEEKQVILTCPKVDEKSLVLVRNGDGSLSAGFLGTLTKSGS